MAEKTATIDRKVPDFTLPATGGKPWKLSAARGKALVVYFYPKDNTSGCTSESIAFSNLHDAFRKAKAVVVGVSPDSIASHEKFKAKYAFPFELLSDEEKKACEIFGVWKEKSMYGRKYMGVERSTFLLDAEGVLRREWRKVKVNGHAEEVLEALRDL
ncbi:MAG: peroxiredoxin [Steroidobacteraceae bacterium]|nr:peroxiredoxin [Steroidobacteraceae bacterium]